MPGALGMEFQPEEPKEFNTVLLCGTGSTQTAAHLLQSYLSLSCKIPIYTQDGFSLPAWAANQNTLVIISGFSGDEPELNTLFSQGKAKWLPAHGNCHWRTAFDRCQISRGSIYRVCPYRSGKDCSWLRILPSAGYPAKIRAGQYI